MGTGLLLTLAMACPSQGQDPTRGHTHRTANFEVTAPTKEIARRVGEVAERSRRKAARFWLGKDAPAWPIRCPVRVTVSLKGSGGASTFAFDGGKVIRHSMEVEGTLDTVLTSVVPHEVTHAVLAHHFGRPVPRWADEGAAVLSENTPERSRHAALVRRIMSEKQRAIPLARLFALTGYPRDVIALYAQGYSVARFLVEQKGRKTFLAFVSDGLDRGWNSAARRHCDFDDVSALEAAWLRWLRDGSVEPP